MSEYSYVLNDIATKLNTIAEELAKIRKLKEDEDKRRRGF